MRVIIKVEQFKITEENANMLRNVFECTYHMSSNSVYIRYDNSDAMKDKWIRENFPDEYGKVLRRAQD